MGIEALLERLRGVAGEVSTASVLTASEPSAIAR